MSGAMSAHVRCDRIVWGKTVNCGQTCVAPDYMLCHESKLKATSRLSSFKTKIYMSYWLLAYL